MATFSTITPEPIITPNEVKTQHGFGDSKATELLLDIPFSQFGNVNHITYSEKFFGVQHNENIDFLENYVNSQIQDKNLEDSVGSYEEIVKQLLTKIGVYDNEIGESKIDRLVKYVKMIGKNIPQKQKKVNLIKRKEEVNKVKEIMKQKLSAVKTNKELQDRLTNQEKSVNRLKELNKNLKDKLNQEQQEKEQLIKNYKEDYQLYIKKISSLKEELRIKDNEVSGSLEEKNNLIRDRFELNKKLQDFEYKQQELKLKIQGLI
jgi:chromosome segregation ATPase